MKYEKIFLKFQLNQIEFIALFNDDSGNTVIINTIKEKEKKIHGITRLNLSRP